MATITITEQSDDLYTLDPFPFAEEKTTVPFEGRWLTPAANEAEGRSLFEAAPVVQQTVTLTAA